MRTERIATATALVATLVAGTAACGTNDTTDGRYAPGVETIDTSTTEAEPTEDETTETDNPIKPLDEAATYESGLTLQLRNFKRGVSSDTAAPGSTAFIGFVVSIDNQTPKRVDMTTVLISCQYGDTGREGEMIFDSARGYDGTLSTSLLPSRSAEIKVGCAMPKNETYLQVEIMPDFDSETAIFSGHIK